MRRGKKIRVICSCLVFFTVLVMGGCGSKEPSDSTKVQGAESTATPTAIPEVTPETATTPAPTATPKPTATPAPTAKQEPTATSETVVLDAAFDEVFEMEAHRKYYVGRDDVSIIVTDIFTYEDYEEPFWYICYVLEVGNECYHGSFSWNEEEGLYYTSQPFSMNRVLWKEFDCEEERFTLMITGTTEIQEPMELSGNPEDVYVLERPEYVEAEDFILFMDTGTKVYGDTVELLETIFMLVEKETGLSLDAQVDYDFLPDEGPKWVLYTDAFDGVDPNNDKYHIYVIPYEKGGACGGYGMMTLNFEDLEISAGEGFAIVHEYTHSLQVANGPWMNHILDEGFTTYITGQITKKDEIIEFNFDADMNYSYYPTEITRENAEQIFVEEPEDGWDDYLYGYRFMTFLMEKYGEDIYRKILAEALAMVQEGHNYITREESVVCVKKVTSPNVFEEFGDWMQVNKERFDG